MQEARGRIRTKGWNARLLRGLAVLSAAIVLGTAVFARPWYWDLGLSAVAIVGVASVVVLLRALWQPSPQTLTRIVALSGGAVMIGIALLGLAGVAFVLDLASLGSPEPAPLYHGGEILETPVLYQLFWGTGWEQPSPPAVEQAVAFQSGLENSAWARDISEAGLGIGHFSNGGCWIDPTPAPKGTSVSTTQSGPFAAELRAVFRDGARGVAPCPGTQAPVPTSLPADALVALWLPGSVPFAISGVAAHGSTPWPGFPRGIVVAGLPGTYSYWKTSSCTGHRACQALPVYATPAYALSHEVLEAATNPYGTGWYAPAPLGWTARFVLAHGPPALLGLDPPPPYPGEVADLCGPGSHASGRQHFSAGLDPTSPLRVAPFYRPADGCAT